MTKWSIHQSLPSQKSDHGRTVVRPTAEDNHRPLKCYRLPLWSIDNSIEACELEPWLSHLAAREYGMYINEPPCRHPRTRAEVSDESIVNSSPLFMIMFNMSEPMSKRLRAGVFFTYAGLLFKSAGSVRSSWVVLASVSEPSRRWGLILLLIFELFNVVTKLYMMVNVGRMRAARRDDLNLCIWAMEVPFFNILAWTAMPEIQRRKTFSLLFSGNMFISGLTLPPAHALMHWIVGCPAYM